MLADFITTWLFSYLLIFTRIGTAMMIMPGIGDSFTPTNIRLMFALTLSLVMTPLLSTFLPAAPSEPALLFILIASEALIGLFIGTVMRILMSAMDTMGMVVSLNTGFANAQVFNPSSGGQGSIIGALMGVMATTMILVTDMHHLLLVSIFESYQMFPANGFFNDVGQMADVIARVANVAFNTGVKMSMPFMIITLVVYTGFGILGRLMPQIQVFFLALPVQILLAIMGLSLVFSFMLLYFLEFFEETVTSTITL